MRRGCTRKWAIAPCLLQHQTTMRSIERRFLKFQHKRPNVSSLLNFCRAVKGQHFSTDSIHRWFNKLVEKDDYDGATSGRFSRTRFLFPVPWSTGFGRKTRPPRSRNPPHLAHMPPTAPERQISPQSKGIISVEEYREILADCASSDVQIVKRIEYLESFCRNIIKSELQ